MNFKGRSVAKNCVRPESVPLIPQLLIALIVFLFSFRNTFENVLSFFYKLFKTLLVCFIVSGKKYDWKIDENVFAKTSQDPLFLVRGRFQKFSTQLQNIFAFSTIHHQQVNHAHIIRDFIRESFKGCYSCLYYSFMVISIFATTDLGIKYKQEIQFHYEI